MSPRNRSVPVLKVTRHGSDAREARRVTAQPPPDLERIRIRAYQIWEQEGRPHGRDREHWHEAERQLAVEFRIGYPDASGTQPDEELAKPGDLDAENPRLSH